MIGFSGVSLLISMFAAVLLIGAAWVLSRTLPLQNIAMIFGSLMAAELALNAFRSGPDLFGAGVLFWPATTVWTRIIFRWFLRQLRRDWNYGLWLILLASAPVALLQFFAALLKTDFPLALERGAVRFAASAFCLFWLSPWFISKLPQQPQERA